MKKTNTPYIIALLFTAILALPVFAAAAQVAAKAEVSRAEVAKGETFSYKLSVISEGEAGDTGTAFSTRPHRLRRDRQVPDHLRQGD